jgi:hypothetical protein
VDNQEMKIQTEFKQRAYDGKWVLYGLIPDPTLDINDFRGRELVFPMRWITLKVYDWIMEENDAGIQSAAANQTNPQ